MTTTYTKVVQQIGDDWVDALNRTADAAAKLADGTQKANADFVKQLPTQLSLSEHVAKLNETLAAGLPALLEDRSTLPALGLRPPPVYPGSPRRTGRDFCVQLPGAEVEPVWSTCCCCLAVTCAGVGRA